MTVQSKGNLTFEFLSRCRTVTDRYQKRGCSWTVESQLLHSFEELAELQRACKESDSMEIIREGCDVILTITTLFDLLNFPITRVQELMDETLQKVEKRSCLITE